MTGDVRCVRAWDSVVVLDFLEGTQRSADHNLLDIVANEEHEGRRILVSRLCTAEVAFFGDNRNNPAAEISIVDFFKSEAIMIAELTEEIAAIARGLVRDFRFDGADAVHVATAVYHGASLIETFDDRMLRRGNDMKTSSRFNTEVVTPSLVGQSTLDIRAEDS